MEVVRNNPLVKKSSSKEDRHIIIIQERDEIDEEKERMINIIGVLLGGVID
jgi:hypothetical protein